MEKGRTFWRNDVGILLLLGLGIALAHVLTNGQYGFHRDELDIIMNARQLDWGYVAYPPLTPLMARIELVLFGSALTGMRLFPALAQGIVAVLVGLMARDMGGQRGAQILAALAAVISPVALTTGMLIQYMSFDYLWWVLVAFFTVRLLATDNPRWWLGIGAGIGLGMQTKYTMAYFVVGLAAGVLLTPARRYLRSAWLWAGAGVALLIILPNLIWQTQHHFIALDFLTAIHARDIQWGRTADFLPKQLYEEVNPFVLPLAIAGLIWCFFAPAGRRFRTLGWMYLTTFVLLVVSRGRSYYVAPAYAMLLAAGAVWLEGWLRNRTPAVRRIAVGLVCVFVLIGAAAGVASGQTHRADQLGVVELHRRDGRYHAGDGRLAGHGRTGRQNLRDHPGGREAAHRDPGRQLRRGGRARSVRAGVRFATRHQRWEQPVGARLRRSGAGDSHRRRV